MECGTHRVSEIHLRYPYVCKEIETICFHFFFLFVFFCLKEHKTNCEKAELEKSAVAKHSWTNDHRIKWNEASILATESHKFSRKMRESIEIEKHSTIDQEGKPLDSAWRALFTVQN